MDPSNRAHARFTSDLVVEVYSGPVGGIRIGEGRLLDVSVSGCLLSVKALLKVGSTYRLHLKWEDTTLDLPGRVAREAGRSGNALEIRHYGLAFNLTGGQEKALRQLVDHLRRDDKPGGGGFMSSYWG